MVSVLIIANIGVAIVIWLDMLLGSFGVESGWSTYIFALPADPTTFLHRPWTILTYMFAQDRPLHLIFNMLWLYWFGRMLMNTDRSSTLLILYIGGGLLGGISYIVANAYGMTSAGRLMGSSAAILSVMVYTAVRQPDRPLPLFILGEIKLKWIAIVTVCITLAGGAGIATHIAHIGGAIFPFVYIVWRKRKKFTPLRRKDMDIKPILSRREAEAELDRLLDKIRISGYDSLSDKEKKHLDTLSKQF